jgi:hypothetical protein
VSDQHTTLLIVSCDDLFAGDIMTSADVRGARYSVYTRCALDELRRGDLEFMREALFGRRKDDKALRCGHWHYWNRDGVQTIRCGAHHGWMTGHALLHALNGGARCDRARLVPNADQSLTEPV